jgi:NADH dehydrogenase/NADH:ubiquinone oxidoreductase subunit G
MSGHYGHETVTTQNLVILDTIPKRNVILILGSIPGPTGSVVTIKTSTKMAGKKLEYTIITKEIQEEILKQNEALENKEALHEANLEAEAEAKQAAEKEAAEKAAEAIAREKEKEAAEKAAKAAETAKPAEKK